jgi:hypothetical protein
MLPNKHDCRWCSSWRWTWIFSRRFFSFLSKYHGLHDERVNVITFKSSTTVRPCLRWFFTKLTDSKQHCFLISRAQFRPNRSIYVECEVKIKVKQFHYRSGGSASSPVRSLSPGKTRYPLYRRLCGSLGQSGEVRKISPPPGFDPRTVQARSQSL